MWVQDPSYSQIIWSQNRLVLGSGLSCSRAATGIGDFVVSTRLKQNHRNEAIGVASGDLCRVSENPDVKAVAEKFVNANSYNAKFIQKMQKLHNRVPGMEIAL